MIWASACARNGSARRICAPSDDFRNVLWSCSSHGACCTWKHLSCWNWKCLMFQKNRQTDFWRCRQKDLARLGTDVDTGEMKDMQSCADEVRMCAHSQGSQCSHALLPRNWLVRSSTSLGPPLLNGSSAEQQALDFADSELSADAEKRSFLSWWSMPGLRTEET